MEIHIRNSYTFTSSLGFSLPFLADFRTGPSRHAADFRRGIFDAVETKGPENSPSSPGVPVLENLWEKQHWGMEAENDG